MIRSFLSRVGVLLGAVVFAVVLAAGPAAAAGLAAAAPAQVATPVPVAFTLDIGAVVHLLVAFVLPVVVGLVTTRVTSAARKAWALAGLSLATSLLVELGRAIADGVTFDVGVAMLAALPAFVVSVASHYGLWKPTGVATAAQRVGASPAPAGRNGPTGTATPARPRNPL